MKGKKNVKHCIHKILLANLTLLISVWQMDKSLEKELLDPFWGDSKKRGKRKKHKEKKKNTKSSSPNAMTRSDPGRPFSFSKQDETSFLPSKETTDSLVESPRSNQESDAEISKNCILWFLKHFPKVILQSASTKNYIILKSKNTKQWKGKQGMEATCQYKSAIDAYSRTSETFKPKFHSENRRQISFMIKDKVWVIDQNDIVKMQKSSSQFDRKWFAIQFYGDFFSLQCPFSSNYLGINEYNYQLECKHEKVNSSGLFKLIIKGSLKVKSTSQFISVHSEIVQANQNIEKGIEETLIFEIGVINSKIYSCSGITQKSNRRYLSCWKDKNIEGTWHLGFPLHGHDQSDMGSLIEEQFEIIHHSNHYFTIKACNGRYISWNGSRLEANNTLINDSSLFEIISHKKKKRSTTFKTLHSFSSSSSSSLYSAQQSSPNLLKKQKTLSTSSDHSHLIKEKSSISLSSSGGGGEEIDEQNSYDIDNYLYSSREAYRKSVHYNLLKKCVPSKNDFSDSVCLLSEQNANKFLLYGEIIIEKLFELSDVLDIKKKLAKSYILGNLFITNYRILFIPNEFQLEFSWNIPLGSISFINFLDNIQSEDCDNICYAFEIISKHWIQPDSHRKLISSGYHFITTIPYKKSEIQQNVDTNQFNPNPKLNLIAKLAFPLSRSSLASNKYFAFHFQTPDFSFNGWNLFPSIENEYLRQIRKYNDSQQKWSIFNGNLDFKICSSYPQVLIQPFGMSDDEMQILASRRSKMRLPSVTWIHPTNGAAFIRCSQPKQGLRSTKSPVESKYFSLICSADNPIVWIMDARPLVNAMANRLKGAGYEDIEHFKEETFTVKIKFLGIGNIHVMRDSLNKLHKLCSEQLSFDNYDKFLFMVISTCCWFDHLKLLLRSSLRISSVIHSEGQTVVLHCSDGWDRTAQLSSLSQIIMDGYYRTICGFAILIEKDWLSFGHKFADRTGQGDSNYKCKERSPIFIQFIDCVWQLLQQQPHFFEFNEWFLLSILEHFTSALFGTFLFNTLNERITHKLSETTTSLWSYIIHHKEKFINNTYSKDTISTIFPVDPNQVTLFQKYYISPV